MDTPTAEPEVEVADLQAAIAKAIIGRTATTASAAVMTVLREGGWVKDGYPPVEQVLADARVFADELILAKLVARFFRVMILGGTIVPDTVQVMDWLRDYIDGAVRGHGPLGKPMVWPDRLTFTAQMLRHWGFQPTPTNPPYVSLRPGGAMSPPPEDPQAPDPRSVTPLSEAREANMGALLDGLTNGVSAAAVDRFTALRAMSAAFDLGATHTVHDQVDPLVSEAATQLRDHQQQADQDGAMVTVSRQAVDEVVAFVENEVARWGIVQ